MSSKIGREDVKASLKELSPVLRMVSFVMLLPIVATVYHRVGGGLFGVAESCLAFIVPSLVLYLLYMRFNGICSEVPIQTKQIMLAVALAWLMMGLVGSLPFIIRGNLGFVDSLFESMSGWTTTGFSMIQDLEGTSKDLLMYRSIMQGVGGLGVISLGLMILLHGGTPGTGYVDMGVQKLKPAIKSTIEEVWKIYLLYIVAGSILLYLAGMTFFDGINHSITAVATGGFTTHETAGYYNSLLIELILVLLMLAGMTSFILHFKLFGGDVKPLLKSTEIKFMCGMVVAVTVFVAASLWGKDIAGVDTYSVFDILRKTVFHVISGMSTCGFATVDLGQWPEIPQTLLTALMYVGGMNSSTSGGIRLIRFIIIVKAIQYSVRKLIRPKTSVFVMKVAGKPVKNEEVVYVLGYSAAYAVVALFGGLTLMYLGYSGYHSLFTVISAMGNDGLAVISGSPWYDMPVFGKLVIMFYMWVGRIEIYPMLLIARNILFYNTTRG